MKDRHIKSDWNTHKWHVRQWVRIKNFASRFTLDHWLLAVIAVGVWIK